MKEWRDLLALFRGIIMKKILKLVFSRLFYVGVAIVFQVFWIVVMAYRLERMFPVMSVFVTIACIAAVLWIVNKRMNPSYKLAWTMLILSVPIFGAVIYLIFGKSRLASETQKKFDEEAKKTDVVLKEDRQARENLNELDYHMDNQSRYIRDYAGFPVYQNTETEYFPIGEELYKSLIQELEKAKHFIFMEYFIIDKGMMWESVLEILVRKVSEGVDVRLIYDDMGCVNTLPAQFYKELQAKGIKCAAFNPFRPIVSVILNNRDHRKITVIDGHTSFTGGINLADEYINRKKRFGHWKDTGVMLKGEAVRNFTVMFIQMWNVITGMEDKLENYMPHVYHKETFRGEGFVQPYADTPLDNEIVGENVYINAITKAKRYVYIFTPYLIIDNEMMTALCLAAKNGVDVRIVTPGIPDKKMVFLLTQSYYAQLLEAGVKIYEYQPGFIHAKSFVCDDELAIVGTINMDYRSLYLHFECAVWMYRTKAVMQLKKDVFETIEVSTRITEEFCRERNILIRGVQNLLRLFAPLL